MSDPVAQDPSYHQFSDSRTLWHIPNFWNVQSNIPFSLVGIWGLVQLREPNQLVIVRENRLAYSLFSTSLMLVFAGSTYYHLDPGNATLVWDRLPMTVAFMALFSIAISETVSAKLVEHFDDQIYSISGSAISGHSIKHMVVAAGVYMLLHSFQHREVNPLYRSPH